MIWELEDISVMLLSVIFKRFVHLKDLHVVNVDQSISALSIVQSKFIKCGSSIDVG